MNNPRTIFRDEEGSIFIEMIFFLPVVILIWTLLVFIYDAKSTAVDTQTKARECAWQYAMSACGTMPAECSGGGASKVSDGELQGMSGGAFATLQANVPGTIVNFSGQQGLHGRSFSTRTERSVDRPSILGGSTTATGRHGTFCADDPVKKWTLPEIWMLICRQHGKSSWCRL